MKKYQKPKLRKHGELRNITFSKEYEVKKDVYYYNNATGEQGILRENPKRK